MTQNTTTIGRHQSRLVRVGNQRHAFCPKFSQYQAERKRTEYPSPTARIASCPSNDDLQTMAQNHQIAAQYADACGQSSMAMDDNPPAPCGAIEAITSPDGRVKESYGSQRPYAERPWYKKRTAQSEMIRCSRALVGYF